MAKLRDETMENIEGYQKVWEAMKEKFKIWIEKAKQRMELSDLGDEYDKDGHTVKTNIQVLSGTISR